VKVFSTSGGSKGALGSSAEDEADGQFWTERAALGVFEHPNIVRMFESFIIDGGKGQETFAAALELCRGGDVFSWLAAESKRAGGAGIAEPKAQSLFKQMLRAVRYIHGMRVVHRDVKLENFLLLGEEGTSEGGVVKLCDFGTAVQLSPETPRAPGRAGTFTYAAPEIFAGRGVAEAGDAWSLGVVLYTMLAGKNPFVLAGEAANSNEEVQARVEAGRYNAEDKAWSKASESAKDLVRSMLSVEEAERFRCSEALRHRWCTAPPADAQDPLSGEVLARLAAKAAPALSALLAMSEAQAAALLACALAVTESDLAPEVPWREVFFALDRDEDDRLSHAELAAGLLSLRDSGAGQGLDVPAGWEIERCVQALDLDRSGYVEWVEWLAFGLLCSASAGGGLLPERLGPAFRLLAAPAPARSLALHVHGSLRLSEGLSEEVPALWDLLGAHAAPQAADKQASSRVTSPGSTATRTGSPCTLSTS